MKKRARLFGRVFNRIPRTSRQVHPNVQELASLQAIPMAKDSFAAVCQEICVEDISRGISDNKIGTIFDLFLQSDRFAPHSHGFGARLSICRDIARLHGGRIFTESQENERTTIAVSLPNSKAAAD